MKNVRILQVSLLIIVASFMLAASASAGGPDKVGYMVQFSLSCQPGEINIGANDNGGGFSRTPISSPVDFQLLGGYNGRIYLDSKASVLDAIIIDPSSLAPSIFNLNWTTFNWDPLWGYREGDLWAIFAPTGTLFDSQNSWNLDLTRSGSIQLQLGQNYILPIQLNPASPVPEPGSLLALGTGLIGLIGFVKKINNFK